MPQAIRVHAPGGPEMLRMENISIMEPGPGEVLLRQTAVGVNFIDIYHRTGLYKLNYPAGLGIEAAGIVEKAGEGAQFRPGDRVAYSGGPAGAYAEYRTLPAKLLVKLPQRISEQVAAAVMLKGLTAHYLLRLTYKVRKGDTILIHAAAGGVGLLVCQWARHLGATVIGTVGSEEKAALAAKNGCDYPILYTKENFAERVKEITQGRGVDVVYDSVGKTTFMDSLDCLKRFGMLVSFGQSSGPVPSFDISILSQKGSLYLTRPILMHYIDDTNAYRVHAAELFDLIEKGDLNVHIAATYPLAEAVQAHRDLEARKTTGAAVLLP
ncbi:MAG: quinone oxidoreductase [Pseudomonadota bacterium]|nr:quinone oxidoreductase [Pseudomonadota bacterium]